jgi:hypothetical protein
MRSRPGKPVVTIDPDLLPGVNGGGLSDWILPQPKPIPIPVPVGGGRPRPRPWPPR